MKNQPDLNLPTNSLHKIIIHPPSHCPNHPGSISILSQLDSLLSLFNASLISLHPSLPGHPEISLDINASKQSADAIQSLLPTPYSSHIPSHPNPEF